jgi:ribosome-binding factor A
VSNQRLKRVESLIVREVSEILVHDVKDPRVVGVVIIAAKVSADLSHATLYYQSHSTGADLERTAAGLESVRGMVKKIMGKRIRLKFLPDIRFRYDPSLEYAEHIDQLLKEVLPSPSDDGDL